MMADVLAKIISGKRDEVASLKQASSMTDLDRAAKAASPTRGFTAALAAAFAAFFCLDGPSWSHTRKRSHWASAIGPPLSLRFRAAYWSDA